MKHLGIMAAIVLSMGIAASADARTRADQYGTQDERGMSRSTEWETISGTIKKMKNVTLLGLDQDNLVVQLQTNQGRRIVDLGNADRAEDLDLEKGDRITAWGRTVKIGDKEVLMAHKLRTNDDTMNIERHRVAGSSTRSDRAGVTSAGESSKEFKQQIRQALKYARHAKDAGQKGKANELVEQSKKALDVAKEAQRAGHNEPLNDGVYALGEAIEHGKKKETKDATEHVMHAIMKLSQSADLQIPEGAVPPAS